MVSNFNKYSKKADNVANDSDFALKNQDILPRTALMAETANRTVQGGSMAIMTDLRLSSEKGVSAATPVVLKKDPSSAGISLVKRLFGMRKLKEQERDERIKKNRGLGSTKTGYSASYRDFQSQNVLNVTQVYSAGDRSVGIRRLHASEFQQLPAIEASTELPKAIEYFSRENTQAAKDSI